LAPNEKRVKRIPIFSVVIDSYISRNKNRPSWSGFIFFDLFLCLFVLGLLFAPFTELHKLDLSCDEFLVFAAPIIDPFAGSAAQFN
jgi:hypothetical protein